MHQGGLGWLQRGKSVYIKKKKKNQFHYCKKPKIRKSCRWLNMLFSGFRRSDSCLSLICLPVSDSTTSKEAEDGLMETMFKTAAC